MARYVIQVMIDVLDGTSSEEFSEICKYVADATMKHRYCVTVEAPWRIKGALVANPVDESQVAKVAKVGDLTS